MKHRRVISVIAMVMLLAGLAVTPVLAQNPPCSFEGDVTLDGAACVGSTVEVRQLDGTVLVTTAVAAMEIGGVPHGSYYTAIVPEDEGVPAEAEALEFYVDGFLGGTSTWESGELKVVNLAAVSGVVEEAPTVVTNDATNVNVTTARTNGSLTDMGTASTVACYFELGTTTAYGSSCGPVDMTATGWFYFDWSGLLPLTTYYFRAVADGDGTSYGDGMSFTTTVAYYVLTANVSPAGSGSVGLSPTQPAGGYVAGTVVTLTATALSGYEFDHWTGDVGCTGCASTTITMNSAETVTAYFEALPTFTFADWLYGTFIA